MLRYCLLLLPLVLVACSGKGTQGGKGAQGRSGTETSYSGENASGDFYRRYSGTIANQAVVLQLHRFAGSYTASYQYNNQGKMIRLSEDESTPEHISFTEYPPEAAGKDQAHLFLRINGAALSGEWVSAAGDKRFPVKLQEEYPEGSARLRAAHIDDTAELVEGRQAPFATASYHYVLSADNVPGFLGRSLAGMLGDRNTLPENINNSLRGEIDAYFARYRKETAPMLSDDIDSDALFAFNYSTEKALEVLYNDNGWVVVRNLSGEYTGGAHGYYASGFGNIDVRGARLWNLSDIVTDTNALRPMLNDAAISYFSLKRGNGMSERLLVDEVPTTGNIFISGTGITFVYNPYEIASYADGEIYLFLPYSKLTNLLTESFRGRMKIGSRAGLAELTSGAHPRIHASSRF
jgi:hypothetical protein